MKKFLNTLFVSLIAITAITFLNIEASAQRRVVVVRKPVYVYENNLYANTQKARVDTIIKRVETNMDSFVGLFDHSLDKSPLNGSNREDFLNKRARDLEHATDELRSEFNRRDSWAENKDEVRRCLNIATDINVAMKNQRFSAATESKWNAVRNELNNLAIAYKLSKVGSRAY